MSIARSIFAVVPMSALVASAQLASGQAASSQLQSGQLAWGQLAPNQVASARGASAISPVSPPDVRIGVDPAAGLDTTWNVAALVVEGRRAGRLVLGDGAVLRGRVVVDGLDTLPGARVFIAAGTQVISIGESRLDGTFVPFVDDSASEVARASTSAQHGLAIDGAASNAGNPVNDGSVAMEALGVPTVDCPPVLHASGLDGVQPAAISFVFAQSATINNQFMQVCTGPHPAQMPVPQAISVTGAPSAVVKGGAGGAGVDVSIECLGNAVLTINGEICNGPGERGADAEAIGLNGEPCKCGGHATAYGGRGGRAGELVVTADTIRWGPFSFASVNFGGDGGDAIAHGGVGGDCPECGVDAGRGGDATAVGGTAGPPARVSVMARTKMVPAPAFVLANLVVLGSTPDGGDATAFSGPGGDAVDCVECPADGGDGGDAGIATAIGGNGAHGELFSARSGGAVTATMGADGGDGGNAKAQAQRGGHGGDGATCPCPFPGEAGSGGAGGEGGHATALGGVGGDATAGSVGPALPTSGWGGDGSAICASGGNAGSAGGCSGDIWLGCLKGAVGEVGAPGVAKSEGGAAGAVFNGAGPGQAGDPIPAVEETCDPGDPGEVGPFDCVVQLLCCVAGSGPGCGDPVCESLVCAQDPFCCEVLWDAICAELAGTLCPQCAGSSNCCVAGPQPGCDDPLCMRVVCSVLPLCCEIQWDGGCAELAGAACGVCAGASN